MRHTRGLMLFNSLSLTTFLIFFLNSLFAQAALTQFDGLDLVTNSKIAISADSTDKIKATALVFISAKCPCSGSHMTELKDLALNYPEIQFVGIHSNLDESLMMSQDFFKNNQLGFPILQDENQKLAEHFGAYKTPHVFVLDSKGEVLYKGGVTNSHQAPKSDKKYLREVLKALAAHEPLPWKQTKALGCAIERPDDNKDVWKE